MLEILYYPAGDREPVKDHLTFLAKSRPKTFSRLAVDLEILGTEGLRSQRIIIRPMGNGLWELKWLLHSIEKKSAKTPKEDLELARRRLREVLGR